MKTFIAAGSLALLSFAPALRAQSTPITTWSFNNDAVAIPVTSPAPSFGSGTALSLGMTNNYTYGYTSGGNTNSGNSVDSSDILAGSGSNGGSSDGTSGNIWRIRGGSGTVGGTSSANGWSSLAPIGTQGAQFSVNTTGYTGIQVKFDWYTTTQGEAKLQLQYTTDGTNWVNALLNTGTSSAVAEYNNTSPNTVTGNYIQSNAQAWYDGITADLSGVSGVNNDPNFAIRLVNASTGADDTAASGGGPLNNTSGNWRFDEVSVSGVAASVPEPSTLALGLGALGLLAGAAHRFGRKA